MSGFAASFSSSSSLAGFGKMSAASVFQKMGPILGAASGLSERVRRLGGRECEQGSRIKVLNMEGGGGMRAESKWKKVG